MKTLLFLLLGMLAASSTAQEFMIQGGQSFTSFEYCDSQNKALENLQSKNLPFLSVGTRIPLWEEKLQITAGLRLHQYGAIGSDNILGNYYEWTTSYAGLQVGIDAQLFEIDRFTLHLTGDLGPEFLVQGTQTLNNQVFDLKDTADFDGPIIRYNGGALFQYKLTSLLSAGVHYTYGITSKIGKKGEQLRYNAHDLGVSLFFSLAKHENDTNSQIEKTQ
ncbi:outer membrane beta-barrel protein [Altibacter sp. HG106]|uniref:outer membrane beta-barrel protein n=1 Tax=Altibacter sp. HG106 TaxID=3023937 RepID=UPI002350FA8E|nr:outer membrane beta-barrel protein [Altibacter sp. HG106]MDC7995103.1 outer membrane beta-barrel protein [Altibacter sp. HG106]